MTTTLETKWLDLADTVLPHDCSETQREEMKRAFYAGVICAVGMIASAESTADVVALEAEARAYFLAGGAFPNDN